MVVGHNIFVMIVGELGYGRVELNMTQVLRKRDEDASVRNGIQIGITPAFA